MIDIGEKISLNSPTHAHSFKFIEFDNVFTFKFTFLWLPAFSPFPTMFSTGFFPRVVKSQDCVVKG